MVKKLSIANIENMFSAKNHFSMYLHGFSGHLNLLIRNKSKTTIYYVNKLIQAASSFIKSSNKMIIWQKLIFLIFFPIDYNYMLVFIKLFKENQVLVSFDNIESIKCRKYINL